MNCDLILNENSCRFCLGDAQDGNAIFCDQKSYFCVEKRLIEIGNILSFLNLKIQDQHHVPNVPNRVCLDCKKSIISFYSLKKNFQDNEAVLHGRVEDKVEETSKFEKAEKLEVDPVMDPVKVELLPVIDEFLNEHINECLQVTKYADKLVICQQKSQK